MHRATNHTAQHSEVCELQSFVRVGKSVRDAASAPKKMLKYLYLYIFELGQTTAATLSLSRKKTMCNVELENKVCHDEKNN